MGRFMECSVTDPKKRKNVTDPNKRKNHCDLNAYGEHTQECADRALSEILKDKSIQQAGLLGNEQRVLKATTPKSLHRPQGHGNQHRSMEAR
jgi:hypothetical protein